MRTGPQPQLHVPESRVSREASETLEKLDTVVREKSKAERGVCVSWCRTRGHLGRALGVNTGLGTLSEGVSWFHNLQGLIYRVPMKRLGS